MVSMKASIATIRQAIHTYSKELGLIGTFFVLTLTLANLGHRLFGIGLLPFFQATFNAFHEWCHIVLHFLVFSWLTRLAAWLWYGITWVGSLLLPIVAWKPHIVIPPLVSDVSLVSVAFTRVFRSTDLIVPRPERAAAENAMTVDHWKEIERLEGRFWGPVHRCLERLNSRIWQLIDVMQRIIVPSNSRFDKVRAIVRALLIGLAGAILFWGFIRLAGYLINVPLARRSTAPVMPVRRRFFRYFVLNFVGASLAVAVFFVLNAWFADALAP